MILPGPGRRGLSGSGEPLAGGVGDRGGAGLQPQLGQDVADVDLDGPQAHEQDVGDFLVSWFDRPAAIIRSTCRSRGVSTRPARAGAFDKIDELGRVRG